jgi:hypothetical protein
MVLAATIMSAYKEPCWSVPHLNAPENKAEEFWRGEMIGGSVVPPGIRNKIDVAMRDSCSRAKAAPYARCGANNQNECGGLRPVIAGRSVIVGAGVVAARCAPTKAVRYVAAVGIGVIAVCGSVTCAAIGPPVNSSAHSCNARRSWRPSCLSLGAINR